MRLLKKDPAAGFLHLKLDALDDLWALRTLLAGTDHVTADTFRTAEAATDKVRAEKMEKRPVRLTVRAESVEWHHFDDHLRVLGPIVQGPDMGRHHTLVLRPDGSDVQVQKLGPLSGWQLQLVDEAVKSGQAPHVLVLAIDDTEAQFALLKSYGIQFLGTLPAGGMGKRHTGAQEAKSAFYAEALKSAKLFRNGLPFVVVGPGWWREEFLAFAQQKDPAVVAGAITDGTAHGGRLGVHEAVQRGTLERVARDARVEADGRALEALLERIAREDPRVTYGPAQVAAAAAAGAIEALLVSDTVVRSGAQEAVLKSAEGGRARVHILSTGHEAGRRLDGLGGIAATLRFALDA